MTRGDLMARFMELYPDLRTRLGARLRSRELADEALNETWLRLSREGELGVVGNARAYLMRMAINIAIDRRRAGARLASAADIDSLLSLPDTEPGPERTALARLELRALEAAMAQLTPRRRSILVSARLEGSSCREIADAMGLSKRTVELELRAAIDHCADSLAALERRGYVNPDPGSSR